MAEYQAVVIRGCRACAWIREEADIPFSLLHTGAKSSGKPLNSGKWASLKTVPAVDAELISPILAVR